MIKAEKLVKKYGKHTVINGLSFLIGDGEKAVVCGKSGAGKTTLLRLVAMLEKPDSGSLEGYSRDDIAFMFQEPRLLPWADIMTNVLAPVGEDRRERAQEMLEFLELQEDTDKYPAELSGGMKQRVALVRALVYDKPILLLDEPFSSLDRNIKLKSAELIKKECKDKTVILISHDPSDYELVLGSYKKVELEQSV